MYVVILVYGIFMLEISRDMWYMCTCTNPTEYCHDHGIQQLDLSVVTGSEGIWLNGKTLGCRPSDCELDPPHQLNFLKGDIVKYAVDLYIYTGSNEEKCSRVSMLHVYTGHVEKTEFSCVEGAPVSCTMGH